MNISTLLEVIHVPIDLDGYILQSYSTLEVIHLCLKPGQSLPQQIKNF